MASPPEKLFEIDPPQAGAVGRVFWLLTGRGRCRRALWQACRGKERSWHRVERATDRLQNRDRTEQDNELLAQLLAHAAWHAIESAEHDQAREFFYRLRHLRDDDPRVAGLAWDLAWCHAESGDTERFIQFALVFVSHPGIDKSRQAQVERILDHAYSINLADDLLHNANGAVGVLSCMTAVRAVTGTPHRFDDLETIDKNLKWVQAVDAGFSPALVRDRLIILARGALWHHDLAAARNLLDEARASGESSRDLEFWHSWCSLAETARGYTTADPEELSVPGTSDRSSHLRALVKLCAGRSITDSSAYLKAYIEELRQPSRVLEIPDVKLALDVLAPVLTMDWRRDDHELKHGAYQCSLLAEVHDLPWCRYSVAVKALCVDTDPISALETFREPAVVEIADGALLQKTAHFLAGTSEFRDSLLDTIGLEAAPAALLDRIDGLRASLDVASAVTSWPTGNPRQIPAVLPEAAPLWAHWLHARGSCLATPVASLVEQWRQWHLEAPAVRFEVDQILEERCPLHADHSVSGGPPFDGFSDAHQRQLGECCAQLLDAESSLKRRYWQSRYALREGAVADCIQVLTDLQTDFTSALSVARWAPLIDYWLALAHLKNGDTEQATSLLEALADSWMADRASAQLAMMAVAAGDTAGAATRLESVSPGMDPGIDYARALVLERLGEHTAAQRVVEALCTHPLANAEQPGELPSKYFAHAQRLGIAIERRSGELQVDRLKGLANDERGALMLLSDTLQEWVHSHDDPIVDTAELDEVQRSLSVQLDSLTPSSAIATSFLNQLVTVSGYLFGTRTPPPDDPRHDHIRQFRALYQLRRNNLDGCVAELAAMSMRDSAAEAVIRTARLLKRMHSEPLTRDTITSEIATHRALLEQVAGDVQIWLDWLRVAEELMAGDRVAVDHIAHASDLLQESAPTALQWDLREFLKAQTATDDSNVLSTYERLRGSVDQLPIPAADIWLHCARVWLQQRNWTELLEGELPESIEDLEDPRVRWVIGLAYSCAGAEASESGRAREAINLLSRARTTLEPMEERDVATE